MAKNHPKVLLTRQLPEVAIEKLEEKVDLEIFPHDRVMTPEELKDRVADKTGLLCLLTDTISPELMDAAPRLKVISNYAVGYNNIDVAAAIEREIIVTNTPDVLTETTADMTFGLMIMAARKVLEAGALLRSGNWKGWSPMQFMGADIHGRTLGIIGMGRIGKALTKRARGFDMEVIYWNRTRLTVREEKKLGLRYVKFNEVLHESDFLSLNVAYNEETHHLIDGAALQKMKQTAFLINTSRGGIIDEEALLEALENDKIAGAGLDVFKNEPNLNPRFLNLKNTVVLPHIASASVATREKMAMVAVDNLLRVLAGKKPAYRVG